MTQFCHFECRKPWLFTLHPGISQFFQFSIHIRFDPFPKILLSHFSLLCEKQPLKHVSTTQTENKGFALFGLVAMTLTWHEVIQGLGYLEEGIPDTTHVISLSLFPTETASGPTTKHPRRCTGRRLQCAWGVPVRSPPPGCLPSRPPGCSAEVTLWDVHPCIGPACRPANRPADYQAHHLFVCVRRFFVRCSAVSNNATEGTAAAAGCRCWIRLRTWVGRGWGTCWGALKGLRSERNLQTGTEQHFKRKLELACHSWQGNDYCP